MSTDEGTERVRSRKGGRDGRGGGERADGARHRGGVQGEQRAGERLPRKGVRERPSPRAAEGRSARRTTEADPVYYDGVQVGDYFADVLVEQCLLVETKAVSAFDDAHVAQCLNYLKATGLKLCLLINFGKPRVEVKRLRR